MSGTVQAGTPWTRDALARFAADYPDSLAAIEALIPDGCHLTLVSVNGKRGSWGARLVGLPVEGYPERLTGYPTVGAACYAALDSVREAVSA